MNYKNNTTLKNLRNSKYLNLKTSTGDKFFIFINLYRVNTSIINQVVHFYSLLK